MDTLDILLCRKWPQHLGDVRAISSLTPTQAAQTALMPALTDFENDAIGRGPPGTDLADLRSDASCLGTSSDDVG